MNKPALVVEHVITADDPFGEPWPPNAAGPWVVVARVRGFTKSRHNRISHIDISVADVLSLRRNKIREMKSWKVRK
jgi:hypothetical protein